MATFTLPESPRPSSYLTRREVSKSMLIAIVAIIALIFLGTQVSTILSKVGNSV